MPAPSDYGIRYSTYGMNRIPSTIREPPSGEDPAPPPWRRPANPFRTMPGHDSTMQVPWYAPRQLVSLPPEIRCDGHAGTLLRFTPYLRVPAPSKPMVQHTVRTH